MGEVCSAPNDRGTSIISKQQVESGKTRIFMTNHVALTALTIVSLYMSRRHVELRFKLIWQHLIHQAFSQQQREPPEDADVVTPWLPSCASPS